MSLVVVGVGVVALGMSLPANGGGGSNFILILIHFDDAPGGWWLPPDYYASRGVLFYSEAGGSGYLWNTPCPSVLDDPYGGAFSLPNAIAGDAVGRIGVRAYFVDPATGDSAITDCVNVGVSSGPGPDTLSPDVVLIAFDESGNRIAIDSANASLQYDYLSVSIPGISSVAMRAGYSKEIWDDFIFTSPFAHLGDVAPLSVDEPPDTVTCGDTVAVAATVGNIGNAVETFDVEAIIDSCGARVYADTQTVGGLLPDSCTSVSFADWVVPPGHGLSYTITVATLLPADVNPANDTLSAGTVAWSPPGIEEIARTEVGMPESHLLHSHPNPFGAGGTTISFSGAPSTSNVSLKVYDLTGQLVRTLIDSERSRGVHCVRWDGTADDGRLLASGVYFYRLNVDSRAFSRRATLMR